MRASLHALTVGLAVSLCTFGIAGCQQDNKTVQAAAEPNTPEPAASSPTASGTGAGPSVTNVIEGADRSFIMQAEKDNIQERYLGRLASEKSQNSDIQSYGRLLSHDHNAALQTLVKLMEKYGVAQPKALPEERQDAFKEVKGLSGAAFDRAFIDMMVKDHQKALEDFKREQSSVQNTDLKNWVTDQIPLLTDHLDKAQDIQNKLESNSGNRKS